jgi:chromosome segregation ATPase
MDTSLAQPILEHISRELAEMKAVMVTKEDLKQYPTKQDMEETMQRYVGIISEDFQSKLSVIAEQTGSVMEDMVTVKEDVSELKQDVRVLKEDVSELKEDVSVLKQDVAVLKEDVSELKDDMTIVKSDITSIKKTLDRKTDYSNFIILD